MTDFNPRSHEGSDKGMYKAGAFNAVISIRAPTRGATVVGRLTSSGYIISIRAPTRGATESSPQHTLY